MKVAYQLRPLPTAYPAVALMVPGRDAADVLPIATALHLGPLPPVHLLADGFLIKLPQPIEAPVGGAIRLRGMSADLLLPVDAEVVPALLPDEAAALVRERGLVFLPGGRVLEYDPDDALPLGALLRVGAVQRPPWTALPEPPALAEDVTEIALDVPAVLPPDMLERGGEGVGTEAPELPDAPLPAQVLGKTLFRVGKSLAWLGKMLHLRGLTELGAAMLGRALSLAPRLSEQLIDKQEAMLRHLLHQFRDGKIEEALKRALPLIGDTRGSSAARDARLPRHDLFYSLVNLLGGGARGASLWFVRGNIQHELWLEYRKQADLAASRGDYRRAAFIYAKLLADYQSAALMLARAGLHRDAAILCEQKLHNRPLAAREWEAAGEIDRALQIYLNLGDHGQAGDLLRRAGEDERAVEQYEIAAAKLVESGQRHYEAGQLLETRAQRPDLAMAYYRAGWAARPHGNPVPCVLRLARHHAAHGAGDSLLALTTEADEFLDAWDTESAATFYNTLARHAEVPALAPVAPDLRDRARLGLARKLAKGAARRGGNYFATLFPAESPWPAPLVRDAEHALAQATRRAVEPAGVGGKVFRFRHSTVVAVHQLPLSKEVFLGLANGEILCYRPDSNDAIAINQEIGRIQSLGAACGEDYLVILGEKEPQRFDLVARSRSSSYRTLIYQHLPPVDSEVALCVPLENQIGGLVGVYGERGYALFRVPDFVPHGPHHLLSDKPVAAILGAAPESPRGVWLLALYPSRVTWYLDGATPAWSAALPWTPSRNEGSTLAHAPVHAVWHSENTLEIMGLDVNGGFRQSRFQLGSTATPKTFSAWPTDDEPFLAFARVRTGLVACVTRTAVHWLRGSSLMPAAPPTPIGTLNVVAAFALPATEELLIVSGDSALLRVPVRG